jgi:hypothetical protein
LAVIQIGCHPIPLGFDISLSGSDLDNLDVKGFQLQSDRCSSFQGILAGIVGQGGGDAETPHWELILMIEVRGVL